MAPPIRRDFCRQKPVNLLRQRVGYANFVSVARHSTNKFDFCGNVIYAIIKANIKRNKIIAISTPNGKRGCFYKFYNNALNKVPGWKELACTIYDDDLVTEEQI